MTAVVWGKERERGKVNEKEEGALRRKGTEVRRGVDGHLSIDLPDHSTLDVATTRAPPFWPPSQVMQVLV